MAQSINVDLQNGVVPVSQAAASLAMLIRRAREIGQPVVITQKGYPAAVLLNIELFEQLRALAAQSTGEQK